MSSLRVADWPVARTNDPIESYEAGENQSAREASERAVLGAIRLLTREGFGDIISDAQIELNVEPRNTFTPQRLRTARKQLIRKGLVVEAGRREKASPTGKAAMTYTLAEVQ